MVSARCLRDGEPLMPARRVRGQDQDAGSRLDDQRSVEKPTDLVPVDSDEGGLRSGDDSVSAGRRARHGAEGVVSHRRSLIRATDITGSAHSARFEHAEARSAWEAGLVSDDAGPALVRGHRRPRRWRPTCATRSRWAPPRRSTSSSSTSICAGHTGPRRGMRARSPRPRAGSSRHRGRGPRRQRAVRRPRHRAHAPPAPPSSAATPAPWPSTTSSTPPSRSARERSGWAARARSPGDPQNLGADAAVLDGIRRALRPGGRVATSAFSAYFQVRWLEDHDTFDAATGVNHEPTEIRDEAGARATTDLWTTCSTPRELRMLVRARGARRRRDLVGRAGEVRDGPAEHRLAGVPRVGPPRGLN